MIGSATDRGGVAATETDEALLVRVAGGDEAALSAVYDRYAPPVYSLLLRMVADRQVAEELAQEVFWRVWRRAGAYDPARGRPASWILGIARHAAVDEVRRRRARPVLVRDDPGTVRSLLEVVDAAPDEEIISGVQAIEAEEEVVDGQDLDAAKSRFRCIAP